MGEISLRKLLKCSVYGSPRELWAAVEDDVVALNFNTFNNHFRYLDAPKKLGHRLKSEASGVNPEQHRRDLWADLLMILDALGASSEDAGVVLEAKLRPLPVLEAMFHDNEHWQRLKPTLPKPGVTSKHGQIDIAPGLRLLGINSTVAAQGRCVIALPAFSFGQDMQQVVDEVIKLLSQLPRGADTEPPEAEKAINDLVAMIPRLAELSASAADVRSVAHARHDVLFCGDLLRLFAESGLEPPLIVKADEAFEDMFWSSGRKTQVLQVEDEDGLMVDVSHLTAVGLFSNRITRSLSAKLEFPLELSEEDALRKDRFAELRPPEVMTQEDDRLTMRLVGQHDPRSFNLGALLVRVRAANLVLAVGGGIDATATARLGDYLGSDANRTWLVNSEQLQALAADLAESRNFCLALKTPGPNDRDGLPETTDPRRNKGVWLRLDRELRASTYDKSYRKI